jgi:hypothetical protein
VGAIRLFVGCLLLAIPAVDAAAQPRKEGAFEPASRLFTRLFRDCAGCADRRDSVHLVIDSVRLTDAWLARHHSQANGGQYGDNAAIADFWYDAVHRRLMTRSLVLHEVADPADLRLGRAPGKFPDNPDFTATLEPGTIVGLVGFVRWSSNGFGSYFAAVQGAVRDVGTGYLDFATVTGETGLTRSGSTYSPEDLVRHVRLHPTGQLEIGYDTNPAARPDASLLVRGDVAVEGSLVVGGVAIGAPPSAPVLACGVRSTTGRGRGVSASCETGQLATGGGGTCASGELRGSRPVLTGEAPAGWELACSRNGAHTVYVICCAR